MKKCIQVLAQLVQQSNTWYLHHGNNGLKKYEETLILRAFGNKLLAKYMILSLDHSQF